MVELLQVYKCYFCGNTVEVIDASAGELVCCGQPMTLQDKPSSMEGKEKHVPVVEKTAKGIKVKVGSVPHPMEPNHYIQWIEVVAEDRLIRKEIHPGQAPELEFCVEKYSSVRAYCNVHGLWKV